MTTVPERWAHVLADGDYQQALALLREVADERDPTSHDPLVYFMRRSSRSPSR